MRLFITTPICTSNILHEEFPPLSSRNLRPYVVKWGPVRMGMDPGYQFRGSRFNTIPEALEAAGYGKSYTERDLEPWWVVVYKDNVEVFREQEMRPVYQD